MLLDQTTRIERAVRDKICVECERRPAGSEQWANHMPRPCEVECPIFANVEGLVRVVNQAADQPRTVLPTLLRNGICLNCHACRTPLADRFTGCQCSLRTHHQRVAGLIEAIVIPASGCD